MKWTLAESADRILLSDGISRPDDSNAVKSSCQKEREDNQRTEATVIESTTTQPQKYTAIFLSIGFFLFFLIQLVSGLLVGSFSHCAVVVSSRNTLAGVQKNHELYFPAKPK